jgi:diacylglycerol O-acyltransferase / wax synthase
MNMEPMKWPTRMNPTDALFWFMDRIPAMRSTIGALMILERAPSRQRLRQELERISYQLRRMRQRVVEVPFGLAPPEWIDDAQFDLDYHMRVLSIPEPGGVAELLAEISPLYATAFDRDRPLWEAYVTEGGLEGGGAVFMKMHHCMLDGVGGTRLFEALLREKRQSEAIPSPRVMETRSETPAALLWRAALYNVEEMGQAGAEAAAGIWGVVRAPAGLSTSVSRGLTMLSGVGRDLSASRADSPLHHRRSLSRRLSTFEMSLPDIDAVRTRLAATNNDIVLTIVCGAMHRWHTSHGSDVRELRALVPVSIRDKEEHTLGNRIGLLAVALPIGKPNPIVRLQIIQQRMGEIKADQRARMYPLLARAITALPLSVAERILRQQTSRTNFVCTNVPGPRQPCYFAGEVIERIYPYAPLVGDHPVAIALYSYRDTICVGLDIDPLSMDDLPHFRDALEQAYDEVLSVGRQADRRPRPRHTRRARRTEPVHSKQAS